MKMYRQEKKKALGLQRMILFIKLFTNVIRFGFETFIRVCDSSNEMQKDEKVLKD